MDNPEKLVTLDTQDTGRRQAKQKTHHYAQTNTNNINNTWTLLQTTAGEDEPNKVVLEMLSETLKLVFYKLMKTTIEYFVIEIYGS